MISEKVKKGVDLSMAGFSHPFFKQRVAPVLAFGITLFWLVVSADAFGLLFSEGTWRKDGQDHVLGTLYFTWAIGPYLVYLFLARKRSERSPSLSEVLVHHNFSIKQLGIVFVYLLPLLRKKSRKSFFKAETIEELEASIIDFHDVD